MAGRALADLRKQGAPRSRARTNTLAEPGPPFPASTPANKQEPTSAPLQELLGFQLRRAHVLFALHWRLSFRGQSVAITPVQGGILLLLDRNPGMSQVALARLMDVEGPTLVHVVDRLEEEDLIARARRSNDRRFYALHITPAGRKVLEAVTDFVPHREAELLVDLSPTERATLLELLQRVVRRGHIVTEQLAEQAEVPRMEEQVPAARPGLRTRRKDHR